MGTLVMHILLRLAAIAERFVACGGHGTVDMYT
jgi:hypothetical protein